MIYDIVCLIQFDGPGGRGLHPLKILHHHLVQVNKAQYHPCLLLTAIESVAHVFSILRKRIVQINTNTLKSKAQQQGDESQRNAI